MAYEARLSDYARGGYMSQDIQEGRAVKITNSGGRNDLPTIEPAATNDVHNVFILFTPPDQFARPTDENLYKATYLSVYNGNAGFSDPIETKTYYKVSKSVLWNPTLKSGELGLIKRGGSYAVPSGAFIDSASIRVPGALVRVNSGQWEVTSTASEAVGFVEEYNTTNNVLIFTLHQ